MYVSYRRRGTLKSVFILHYCSSTGTCQPYKYCYFIFMYHSMRFYMVYSHWLWQLPQTALYLDIIITGYYVIHICNLEQFENKVTYLLTQMYLRKPLNITVCVHTPVATCSTTHTSNTNNTGFI